MRVCDENATMPRWLRNTICALVMVLVFFICVHPAVDLSPTVFRYAAFMAAVLLILRSAFRFVNAAATLQSLRLLQVALASICTPSPRPTPTPLVSLRC
jgi:hypothetical protein